MEGKIEDDVRDVVQNTERKILIRLRI